MKSRAQRCYGMLWSRAQEALGSEAARFHHFARCRCGVVAARGARAARRADAPRLVRLQLSAVPLRSKCHDDRELRKAELMAFDLSSLFWIFIAIMVLQPLFTGRWYALRRAQAIRAIEGHTAPV